MKGRSCCSTCLFTSGSISDRRPLILCPVMCLMCVCGGGGGVGWLVGWLLPLCPSARPGPRRLQAMGGRGCVTRCTSHEPRAPGLARAALARSRSVRHVRVHRVARGALPARTLFRRSHLLALPPSPSVVCPRCAPLFCAGARRLRRPGAFRPGGGVGAEARPRRWP